MTRIQLLHRNDDNSEDNPFRNDVRFSIDDSASEDRLKHLGKVIKQKKDQNLMLMRVLMKYLESKDPDMHHRAKTLIRESAEKAKRKEQGFESFEGMMLALRNLVGEQYWNRAQGYLKHFLQQRKYRTQRSRFQSCL